MSTTPLAPPTRSPFFLPQSLPPDLAQKMGNAVVSLPWIKWFQQVHETAASAPEFVSGTHANRTSAAAGSYPEGTVFYETDRKVYYIAIGSAWVYYAGTMSTTQGNLPSDLGANDAGFLAAVTDYEHTLEWTGSTWNWAPGESGSDFVQMFLSGPSGGGWHVCNGATVNRLNADGSTASVTLPDYSAAAYLKVGTSAAIGPTNASGATDPKSAGTPSGDVSQPTFTGDVDTTTAVSAGTPSGTISGSTGNDSASQIVASGVGATVPAEPHTHSVGTLAFAGNPLATHTHDLTPTGTVSKPVFAGDPLAPHTHGAGNVELRHSQLIAYYRI